MFQEERVCRAAARPPAKQLPGQCFNQSAKAGAARSCSLPEHSICAWNLTLGVLEFNNRLEVCPTTSSPRQASSPSVLRCLALCWQLERGCLQSSNSPGEDAFSVS